MARIERGESASAFCSPRRQSRQLTSGLRWVSAGIVNAARSAHGPQRANQGTDTRTLQAHLGHRNIQHTVRYTELSPTRFNNLWRD
jgi:hypothetical protein